MSWNKYGYIYSQARAGEFICDVPRRQHLALPGADHTYCGTNVAQIHWDREDLNLPHCAACCIMQQIVRKGIGG